MNLSGDFNFILNNERTIEIVIDHGILIRRNFKFDHPVLPAYINIQNIFFWYKNEQAHRDGNKPAKVHSGGYKYYYLNGIFIK